MAPHVERPVAEFGQEVDFSHVQLPPPTPQERESTSRRAPPPAAALGPRSADRPRVWDASAARPQAHSPASPPPGMLCTCKGAAADAAAAPPLHRRVAQAVLALAQLRLAIHPAAIAAVYQLGVAEGLAARDIGSASFLAAAAQLEAQRRLEAEMDQ